MQLVAAVGRPDAYAGELPVAYVQLKPGRTATEAELIEFTRSRIGERAALPKHIRIVPQLPLTPVGKIFKPALKYAEIKDLISAALRAAGIEKHEVSIGDVPTKGVVISLAVARVEDDAVARHVLGTFSYPFSIQVTDAKTRGGGRVRIVRARHGIWRSTMAKAATENVRPNRMSRQKQKTRSALINAALSVMALKGADATTINDITEAADVGFGSFYNHFLSKEEILEVVTEHILERIANYIDGALGDISDPWEILASSLRLFVEIMIANPEWAQFTVRMSVTPGHKHTQIFDRLYRDIAKAESPAAHRSPIPALRNTPSAAPCCLW